MKDIIEFEVISKKNKNIKIKGFVEVKDIDTDEALQFYDSFNQPQWRVPQNPYRDCSKAHDVYEDLKHEFQTDDLFIQFIADFSTDTKEREIIEREQYDLLLEK